jgi:excisionase family DNA binding protein
MTQSLPRVLTPGMVAEIWHCSERHVRNLIATGELPSFRAGGKLIRVYGAEVEAYECRNGASPDYEGDSHSPSTQMEGEGVTRLAPLTRAKLNSLRQRYES